MSLRILRFPEPRQETMAPRPVIILEMAANGEETEVEVLEIEPRSPRLKDVVQGQIEDGHLQLVIDLINEKHIDSTDLAEILDAWQQADTAGGELVIAHPKSNIQEIFRITNLDQVMKLFDSLQDAMDHFAQSG